VGTGIGSAVLASGTIIAGHGGGACSFGWATADLADPGEDVSGWLERQAAGRAFDHLAASLDLPNGHALMEAARKGDSAALSALQYPIDALGAAIGSAVALLDPAMVIIAGEWRKLSIFSSPCCVRQSIAACLRICAGLS